MPSVSFPIFTFGARSLTRLQTCHEDLQLVAHRALAMSTIDFAIIWGLRGREAQNEAFATGASKKQWPESMHNGKPEEDYRVSHAFDFAPWIGGTIPWDDAGAFYAVAAVILAAGKCERVPLRYGGDWDRDGLTRDQSFFDLGHIERIE